jgi:hypothetical protein
MTHKEFTDKILVFKKKPWRNHKKHSRVEERAHHHGHKHHHKRLIAEIEEQI